MIIEEIIPKGKKKVLVKTDEGISFSLYTSEARRYAFSENMEVSPGAWEDILKKTLVPRAKKRAMHLLEKMDRTESGLLGKLKEGGYPDEAADEALSYVKSYGYIDDARYCGSYIRTYQNSKSRRVIYRELLKKGISRDTALSALETEYEGDEAALIEGILKKEHFSPETSRADRARIYNRLLRKGFSSEDILKAMKCM